MAEAKDLLLFDMDGVLVDVTESYRAAIQATVLHFTGYEPNNTEIQEWKNRGGYNDDWKLSHAIVQSRGFSVLQQSITTYFQDVFLGSDTNGLILKEKWLAGPGLFDRLGSKYDLAVFTGRFHDEAMLTIDRFATGVFSLVLGADEVSKTKPDPEGILKIRAIKPLGKAWYIGDTVDDARASRAAGMPFIGIASPTAPKQEELVALLRLEGAVDVVDNINFLEDVIA